MGLQLENLRTDVGVQASHLRPAALLEVKQHRFQLIGVETRTSAPVRILREPQSLQSPSHPGLFPAGEGGGFAGGIVSAALDGLRVADAVLG